MVLYVSHALSKECEDKMAENNKEVWFPTRLWISGEKFDYITFLLLFVKLTIEELKELKLIKRWYFSILRGPHKFHGSDRRKAGK
jgi:hypothetical protein